MEKIDVLDHGYVILRNISGPTRRPEEPYDAKDIDPANTARMSFDGMDKEGRTEADDLKLVSYLMKNKHTTPIEMIEIWLEMKMPIFVARQFVRHRTVSINEISARYSVLPNEFYIPDYRSVGKKSETNKQGRTISGEDFGFARNFCVELLKHSGRSYENYKRALDNGVPNELARCFLPVNIYTKWIWKQDLHNMMHFLSLRLDPHAQYEAREYAEAIFQLLCKHLPYLMAEFRETIVEMSPAMFKTSGTWIKPADLKPVLVEVAGGGSGRKSND